MVQQVGSRGHGLDVAGTAKPRPPEHPMPDEARNGESVGHRAKAEVAESGDSAPNALGKAASLIARAMLDKAPVDNPTAD